MQYCSAHPADVKWATEQRFKWCDLHNPADESQYLHYFQDSAAKLAGLDLPRRSVAIAKELSLLAQNIPSSWGASIFLRVDETRVDILKALIIGPPGTPYANGCFLFDIFLPQDYNLTSPNVQSMTTNGGKYRYNPNLYADGVSTDSVNVLTTAEGLPQSSGHLEWSRLDARQVDTAAGPRLDPELNSLR